MEGVNYCHVVEPAAIPKDLYDKLDKLGLIPNEVRKDNVGKSDYSKHIIQPWSIWADYGLNAWDADIVKRILRTKTEPGVSEIEARIMDYEKIIHICKERIRQLNFEPRITTNNTDGTIAWFTADSNKVYVDKEALTGYTLSVSEPIDPNITYTLEGNSLQQYINFVNKHKNCGDAVSITFKPTSGLGTVIIATCNVCGKDEDITDYTKW